MAFTYTLDKLPQEPLFQLRFQIGDTVNEVHSFEDEELQYILTQCSQDVQRAAIQCCDIMLAKLAGEIDFSVGPYSESGSDARTNRWAALKRTLTAGFTNYSAPVAQAPTTSNIFNYDMMSQECCDRNNSSE